MSALNNGTVFERRKFLRSNDPGIAYCNNHSTRFHPVQEKLREVSLQLQNGGMIGASDTIHLNEFLIRTLNAKKVLDVGVFTGISALAAALTLPEDGIVVALDIDEEFINKIAKPHWKEAGVDHKIDVHIQSAEKSLHELIDNGEAGTFDFAFIDADKPNYHKYYELCLTLLRPGGVIVFDNTLWSCRVMDDTFQDQSTVALRKLNELLPQDDRVNVVMLSIGDGSTLAYKK